MKAIPRIVLDLWQKEKTLTKTLTWPEKNNNNNNNNKNNNNNTW